ncbi:MAG: hypothetical protein IJK15_00610 [Bacteroidaceae bacterium]|nr:hypothetical protein [Bacteroidaceae bacterium]
MHDRVTLPQWLDHLIFDELGAKYCRSNSDMTVIDWDKNDVLNYLGTYFPRSYAESYCIFSDFFRSHSEQFANKEDLSVFDFGCGTGGEIIGLLTVLAEYCPTVREVRVVALDGNDYALQLYDIVLAELKKKLTIKIENHSTQLHIDDFYDLSILNKVLKRKFDVIITFKAICEFVTKQQFEQHNAYEHVAKFLLHKLTDSGIMLLVDVTTYNNTSKEWLPKMLDRGLATTNCHIVDQNKGYNQSYSISHSRFPNDISKVAWRMIRNKSRITIE